MRRGNTVFGACIMVACSLGLNAIAPGQADSNVKAPVEIMNEQQALAITDELSGTTTASAAGVSYYLDKLAVEDVTMEENTGVFSFSNAGIAYVLPGYDKANKCVTASVEDLDIATKFVPEGSIIAGYTNLGISNVSDYLNVRNGAGTEHKIVGKMPGNCACEIISEENGWYKIKSGDVEGYVFGEYILTGYSANVKAMESMSTELYVNCDILNVRQEPSTSCDVATSVAMGEYLEIIEELDGWYKVDINNLTGYVSADYVNKVNTLPTAVEIVEVVAATTYHNNNNNNSGSSSSNSVPNMTYTNLDSTVSQTAVDLINYGMQFLGNPYVHGGSSLTNGTDCSGFVMLVFQQFGYSLPRSSSAYLSAGTVIPVDQAKPGDIFLYNYNGVIGHVGIYIGNGQLMHASTPSQGIKIGSAFYTQPYCAVRVIP